MGLGLSHPITSKRLYRFGNASYKVGMATMHGWRETMEDDHTVKLSLSRHPDFAFFGIFDGHSGSVCARFMADILYKNLDNLDDICDNNALAKICLQTDDDFLKSEDYTYNDDGCACIFTIINKKDGKIILNNGNIGDSRTVFAKHSTDNTYTAVPCTFDHKPTDEKERERIIAANGYVSLQRVDGQLALSRAFGDRQLKTPTDFPGEKKKVSSFPDFITINDGTTSDFLFMACDGIYEADIFDRQTVIEWIANKMLTTNDLAKICADLLDECLERGSHDNMSAMIIQFQDGTSYSKEGFEFIPGPWHESEQDKKFQTAYIADAKAAGFTIEKAHELRK
jgi:serine/threonine protein phosphatase PrpC